PNEGIGGLCPKNVNDPAFDPLVRSKRHDFFYPGWREQEANLAKPTKFHLGDWVYVTFTKTSFYKSYDLQRGAIFKVIKIDNLIPPTMYKLAEEDGTPVKNLSFYEKELKSAPNPSEHEYPIEKIVASETDKNGRTRHLVKFLHYPAK
ncbi:MAG TPA: hypothetical protein VIY47_00175, partial [Ignavibacteriaceae bacterium]